MEEIALVCQGLWFQSVWVYGWTTFIVFNALLIELSISCSIIIFFFYLGLMPADNCIVIQVI